MNYGKAIRITRALADISQRELARNMGTDPSYISLLEANKREPSREVLEKLAEVFRPLHLLILLATEGTDSQQSKERRLSEIAETLANLLFAENEDDGTSRVPNRSARFRKSNKARTKTKDKSWATQKTGRTRSVIL